VEVNDMRFYTKEWYALMQDMELDFKKIELLQEHPSDLDDRAGGSPFIGAGSAS
jgi:hypothetical protein